MGNIGSSTPAYFNTPQTGAQYRITPQNYRQILGEKADIVLKPEQMKDMFEKGYLDVQRQFTQQESNEGIFTIAAKAMATFIGPSKSIGAITIDSNFLEMIKDPNAEIGFGYTRLRQETLTPLPYPQEPERPAIPPAPPSSPTLQQTDVSVTTPQQQTEKHRDQLVKFRKEQEQQTQTPGTSGIYMVERNSSENNSRVKWRSDGGARESKEFGTLVKKYEAEGAPRYWNTELVQDATWEGAYVEAVTQDRDTAVRFQYATRGNIDMETARKELEANHRANTVATRQTEAMLRYVNQKTNSNLTMADVLNKPNLVREKMAQAYGFGSFKDVQAISQHARDFRAIGYISGENPKVATHQIGQMSTKAVNQILRTQISGQSTKADGTSNFYDTIGMLSSRNVNQPGFDAFKPADATANTTLLDVYRIQTQNTPIPEDAIEDYQRLYNETFKTNLTLEQIKAAGPTLQDMYALRASNFYATNRNPLPVTANNGRVTMKYPERDINRVLNVRLVLEANNGGDQVHRFGQKEIDAVNARVVENFKDSKLTLRNNLGQNISADQLIQRLQINEQDSEAVDTAMVELRRTGELRASGSNEVIAKFEGGVLKKTDGKGGFEPVKPEEQSAFLSQVAQQFTNPDGSYNTQILDGGVGHGFVGGTAGTASATYTQTPEVEVRASEMLQLANGKASQDKVNALKASLGITEEISQQDLFKRVLTDAFGQSPDQATEALTGAQAKPTPNFSFPTPPTTSNSGVHFTPPDPNNPTELVKTESSSTTTGPSVESLTEALNANLNTMGELAQIQNLIPKDPNSIGQLKTQILADLDALERSGATTVKIGNPPTDTPISTVRASVTESFGKIEASVAEGQKAMRSEALRRGLAEDDDFSQVVNQTPGGLPPIPTPPAPTTGIASTAGEDYQQAVQNSVKAFSAQLREMVRDGDISTEEKATIRHWLDTNTRNMGAALGLDPNTLNGSNLAQTLREKGYSDADINTISRTVDMLKDAQANVNLNAEASSFHRVLDNVRSLQQKLKEFETVGVVRNAFVGEMKDLANRQPEKFDAVIRSAYRLPSKEDTPPPSPEALERADRVVADLSRMAKEGKMPIPANINFVNPADLGGANAAYIRNGKDGEPIILLSRELLDRPGDLSNALAEEMFHHMESQTYAFRAEEALGKLPPEIQTSLKEKPNTPLSAQQINALTPDQKKNYDDYRAARNGTYDTVGDEGRAGMRALRAAQQGQNIATIQSTANTARMEPGKAGVAGQDQGLVTIEGVTYKAEFQSVDVQRGGVTGFQQPTTASETNSETRYSDTGLDVRGINPHDTGRRYTDAVPVDNLPPTNDPVELQRRQHLRDVENQLNTFMSTDHRNADGSPMTPVQKEQKRARLESTLNDLRSLNAVQYAQKYNVQVPSGSTHQMEQKPDDFWGKAKEMGGKGMSAILQYLSTGAPGALCDQIASQIESVWKSFYANATQNSSAADRSIAEDVVQSGFEVGRDGNYNASRTNLINPQGQQMLNKSMQDYQKANPGFRQEKSLWNQFADQDERHRKAFNGVFNR